MINKKIIYTILTICLLITLIPFSLNVKAQDNSFEFISNAKSAILIESNTETVLYEKNCRQKLAPASMTKMMTLKLILDSIKEGRIKSTDVLTTSEYASSMGGSQIYLSIGEKMTVSDLLKSVAIASANDACVVLAEAISGSESSFVAMMNKESKKMGLKNTNFTNCTGLPDNEHYSCSYDMAIIGAKLIKTHQEDILNLTSIYDDYIRENSSKQFWLVNTNRLIKFVEGLDGLKTGWHQEAGYCLTATMKKNDMRLISVTMGCTTPDERTKDTLSLLNYGFANYEKVIIKDCREPIINNYNILLVNENVEMVLKNDFVKIITKGEELPPYEYVIIMNSNNQEGILQIKVNNEIIEEIPIVPKNEISKASFWIVLKRVITKILF